ncbi:MAG: HAD family phosphatase [Dehalococcoidia bacterium]|nr:HAD family phosphatase [Dehalococcoidia bacterium]
MRRASWIQAVFFDFGGVLQQHMDGIDHKAIESRLGLEERTLMRALYRDSRYLDFQVGKCTYDEWLASVQEAVQQHCGDKAQAVMRAWQEAERPLNEDMISLVKHLRAGGYRTGIISNTIPGMEERLRAELPHLVPLFDVRVGSGDLGIAKPDPEIYLHAARLAGIAPQRCAFTDDVHKYALAARDVGMHGFHFTGYEQFAQDLRSVGVRC